MAAKIHGFQNDFTGSNQPRYDRKEITGPYNGEEDDNDEHSVNQIEEESKERENDEETEKQNEEKEEEREAGEEKEEEEDEEEDEEEEEEEDDDDDDDYDDDDDDDEEEEEEEKEEEERAEEEEGEGVDEPQREVQNEILIDRISDLPESLILRILSSLSTEEVGRTSILSKRWQFLWTSVPNLVFYDHNSNDAPFFVERDLVFYDPNRDTTKFVERVYRALLLHKPELLKKFVVGFMYRGCNASDVDVWIRFAIRSKVEHLGLRLVCLGIHSTNYQLPQYVYSNALLTNLELSFVKVLSIGSVTWTSLKSLVLEYLVLTQETIKKILLGSPVLEFLRLSNFVGNCSEINSTSLQEIVIENHYRISTRSTLDISVPNVKSLHISGDLHGAFLQLINASSLVSAKIDYCPIHWGGSVHSHKEMCDYMNELLVSLNHVKELELGSWCTEILSALVVKGLQDTFPSNLNVLTVESHMGAEIFPGLFGLLQSSLDLETLVIKRKSSRYEKTPLDLELDGRRKDFWMSQGSSFSHCFQHLRTVKITSFVCPVDPDELMLKFVKFLLQNARVLEKMEITVGATSKCTSCQGSPTFVDVAQNLLSFPRSSPSAIIALSP